jgi:hypothetical protein
VGRRTLGRQVFKTQRARVQTRGSSCLGVVMCCAILALAGWAAPLAAAGPLAPDVVRASTGLTTAAPAWVAQSTASQLGAATHDDELYGISCIKGKGCLAVGKWFDAKTKTTNALAEIRTGTAWALNNPPAPAGSTITAINGISCVATPSAVCLVVGQWGSLAGSYNYAALWDWSSWKLLDPPDAPSSTLDQLNAVACVSSVYCVATGHFAGGTASGGQPESLVWDGSTWALKTVPIPSQATTAWLYGVSCPSTLFCFAVGDYTIVTPHQPTLAETWNGTAWTVRPSQSTNQSNALASASCVSTTLCEAVGNSLSPKLAFSSLAGSLRGKSFHLQATPNSGPKVTGDLRGVSCLSSRFCMAVGNMSAVWNGTSWSSEAFPEASPVLSIAYAVSCTSKTSCTAVGSYVNGSGGLTLIANWHGTSWQQQAAVNP